MPKARKVFIFLYKMFWIAGVAVILKDTWHNEVDLWGKLVLTILSFDYLYNNVFRPYCSSCGTRKV